MSRTYAIPLKSSCSRRASTPRLASTAWPIVTAGLLAWSGHPVAALVVGIDFAETGARYPGITTTPLGQPNFTAYDFVDSSSPFAADGALDGWTNGDLQAAIVDHVRRLFRLAEIDAPGCMLDVDLRLGPVDPTVGINHVVGDAIGDPAWFGSAFFDAAHTRPDLNPDPNLPINIFEGENTLSATAVDSLANSSLTYDTVDEVVYAIGSTVAQEIAHNLGVPFDVPAGPYNGIYPVMASGLTGLPLAARLTERAFLDVPNTQPDPALGLGGPLTYSVTDVLVEKVGVIDATDLNFDGFTDASDLLIWFEHRFTSQSVPQRGDVNADGVVDANDLFSLYDTLFTSHGVQSSASYELPLDRSHLFTYLQDTFALADTTPAVPEPSAVALFLIGHIALTSSRRAHRRSTKTNTAIAHGSKSQ